jgi:putative hemolysin
LDEPPGYTNLSFFQLSQPLDIVVGLAGIVVLCLLWFWVATVEAAIYTLAPGELGKFTKGKGLRDKAVMFLMNYPQHLQITNLILRWGIKISLITMVLLQLIETESITIVVLLSSLMCVLVLSGEMFAKKNAKQNGVSIARSAAPVLAAITVLIMPFSIVAISSMKAIVKFLGQRTKASEKATARVLQETFNDATPHDSEMEMAKSVLNFGATPVKQLMRLRKEIVGIDVNSDFHELIEMINRSGRSRIPVYRSTFDKIEGVIYIKDIIPFIDQQSGFEWQKLLRPAFFISESSKLTALLKDFQQKHVHLALVVDKFGRITGLITLQDLVEEVIDDINEEFNTVNPGAS